MDISLSSLSLEVPAQPSESSSEDRSASSLVNSQQRIESINVQNLRQWREPVDFIAMVSLALGYNVHQVELESSTGVLPETRQQKKMYTSFTLGEGASSFLELHEMRQHVDLPARDLRKGDLVALKRAFMDRFDDEVGVTQQQYDFMRRELRVFCHQELRSHENICQLLFVGWEEYSPAPALALELAEYGTLKDVLFDANLQEHKSIASELVLDIALGLDALHKVGFVHGDVKTGNILVFAHPQRKVVAKLSDFSDSINLRETQQSWAPVGGTHTWRAPECYGTTKYELKRTDIYSFGLCALAILAQGIWHPSANNTGPGDCFLVRMKELDGKSNLEIQSQVTLWKQDATDLVLKWGLEWVATFTKDDDLAKINATYVVLGCLSRDPGKRKCLETIIQKQFELLGSTEERQRQHNYYTSQTIHDDQSYRTADDETDNESEVDRTLHDLRMASINDTRIQGFHLFFKQRMLRSLESIGSLALTLDFPQAENVSQHSVDLTFADLLLRIQQGSLPIIPADIHEKTVSRACAAAAQVAEAYSVGFGTMQVFLVAQKWLAVSARCGKLDHAAYFSVIDDALGYPELYRPEIVHRELWLLVTASGGCTETFRILRERYPSTYPIAEHIRKTSGSMLREVRNPEVAVSRVLERARIQNRHIDDNIGPLGFTILHFSIAVGDYQAVHNILENGANVNATDYTGCIPLQLAASCGDGQIVDTLLRFGADPCLGSDLFEFTPLHFLSYVDDNFLEPVAESMIQRSTQLSAVSSNRGSVGLENPFQSLQGTPLQWAARKPNERLFHILLRKHLTFNSPVTDLDDILKHLAVSCQSSMLNAMMKEVSGLRSNQNPLSSSELDLLLALSIKDIQGVRDIMIHRAKYKKARMDTIEVLLEAGADIFRLSSSQLGSEDNVLERIVVCDHLDILRRAIVCAKDQNLSIRQIFEDTRRFGGRDIFQRAIYCSSWNIFQYLAGSAYINLSYRSESGMTALHAAATRDDPRFIDVLLRLGCDSYARSLDGRTPFQSAIYFKAFRSATRLLQPDACIPERLFAATVEACGPNGITLFASLIAAAMTNYRHVVNFTSIRYLESVGAFTYINHVPSGSTILQMMAMLYPFVRPDYEAFDRAMLEYILRHSPPTIINQYDEYGLTPLHWMVIRGNLSAIRTLLTHPSSRDQIDVNIETIKATTIPSETHVQHIGSNPGKTALNLALLRRRRIPNLIKSGGKREILHWGLRTEAIVELLKEIGASLGSGSDETERMEEANITVVRPADNIIGSLLAPVSGQGFRIKAQSHEGQWPLRLGKERQTFAHETNISMEHTR